jgi:hypothetical protein
MKLSIEQIQETIEDIETCKWERDHTMFTLISLQKIQDEYKHILKRLQEKATQEG